ncbi:hypothetical protein AK812_SmicGene13705 [Symbiodinium microadriaticum]|uniref:Uncharacterized protein n=1 Tax=Symbiodinium microadriaticum TaxID=2951 RepID=A0A1Q9E7I5_SYMMI|nr:hypothetical protein AK812_SmicGene13705 [Symbiodinium microadriaticum]
MESRSTEDGQERPGHAVWLVRGRSLLKCAPEQLRPASHREELVDSLAQDSATPWTFSRLTAEIGGNQFEDISAEIPPESEWRRAQDVTQEVPPSRTRLRGKRPVPLSAPTDDLDLEEVSEPSQPSRFRRTQSAQGPRVQEAADVSWWQRVPEAAWVAEETSYWTDTQAAVEVAIDLPHTDKEWKHFAQDATAYVAGMIKRRAVEVSERKLSTEDQLKFKAAKAVEVKNFISAQAFEALPSHLKPSREQAIGMRWLLTWKVQDDGSVKPKEKFRWGNWDQAAVNGEDVLYYIRYQWAEMMGYPVHLREPSRTVAMVDGCLITDSRNVYDKLKTAVLTIQGAEKKANLELLGVKESMDSTNLVVRWVHSEAQLANALTKRGGRELELYYRMNFTWRIVEDPEMRSARRRRSEGLETFEQTHLPISSV